MRIRWPLALIASTALLAALPACSGSTGSSMSRDTASVQDTGADAGSGDVRADAANGADSRLDAAPDASGTDTNAADAGDTMDARLDAAPDASGTDTNAADAGDTGVPTDPRVAIPPVKMPATTGSCPAGYAADPINAGQHQHFGVDAQDRSFYIQLPDPTKFAGPRPLLVLFNGTGGNGKDFFAETGLQAAVDKGFIVLAPDSNGNGTIWPVWDAMHEHGDSNPNPDLDFFDTLVTCVAAHHDVDDKRVCIGGHSAGGIMANYVLERRDALLAGGIVGSGVFDLTQPSPPPSTLAPMAVIITWGGANDGYSGSAGSGVSVPRINFVEQASIASKYYAGLDGFTQVDCHGDNIGHKWLDAIDDWMLDFLLEHPKGLSPNPNWTFSPPAASTKVTCSATPFQYVPVLHTVCKGTDQCQAYCQLVADCGVDNGTLGPLLSPQFQALGFSGDHNTDCGGCLTACADDAKAGGSTDTAVLQCLGAAASKAECGLGIAGAKPFIAALNTCCKDQSASKICGRACTALMARQIVVDSDLFPSCAPWMP